MDVPAVVWWATIAGIIALLLFDFFFHVRRAHIPSLREAAGVMVSVSELLATAPCIAFRAVVESTGLSVSAAVLARRVVWEQLVTIERAGDTGAVLRVKLPLVEFPAGRQDWAWHVLGFTLPRNVPASARLCTPTLRVRAGRVRVDLPFAVEVPAVPAAGHTVAVGYDWGLNTLLTGTVGRLTDGRVVSDGRMLRYDATAISAKLHRLRRHREHLTATREKYATLLAGLDPADTRQTHLQVLHARTDTEHGHVCARIRNLNHALAWSAARWAVDQAHALHATAIYLEDLTTLETRGHRRGNARLSGHVRGTVADAIGHLARKAGIAVVTVPARGTSKFRPRRGEGTQTLQHTPARTSRRRAGSGRPAHVGCPRTGTGPPRNGSSPAACCRSSMCAPIAPPANAAP